MMDYNNSNGFTSNEKSTLDNRLAKSNYEKTFNPLDVEKYETLTFSTKVTNKANGREAESNSGSYAKYNTTFDASRSSSVYQGGTHVKPFSMTTSFLIRY